MNIKKVGSPQELIFEIRNRISKLSTNDVESCDEVVTENCDVEAGTDLDPETEEVLHFLGEKGYDTDAQTVRNYSDAVAEYMDMSREAYKAEGMESPYTLDQWYEDTKMNYPDELDDLPMKVESAVVADEYKPIDKSAAGGPDPDLAFAIEQGVTDEVFGRHDFIDDVEVYCGIDGITTTVTLDIDHDGQILDFSMPYEQLGLDEDSLSDDIDVIADDIDAELDEIGSIEESTSTGNIGVAPEVIEGVEDDDMYEYDEHEEKDPLANVSYDEVVDWFYDHATAYEDIIDWYDVSDISALSWDEIMDWVSEHPGLEEDLWYHFRDRAEIVD